MFSAVNRFQAEKTLKGKTQQKKLKVKKKSLICKQSDVPVSKLVLKFRLRWLTSTKKKCVTF